MLKRILQALVLCLGLIISYYAHPIVVTYLLGVIIAYLLQPLAKKSSQKLKIPYQFSAVIVFMIFFGILGVLGYILVPTLYEQIELLIKKINTHQQTIQNVILPSLLEKVDQVHPAITEQIRKLISNLMNNLGIILTGIGNYFWRYLLSAITIVTLSFLLPVVVFYLLKDWPRLTVKIERLFRRIGFNEVNNILHEVDVLLSSYIRGILTVCLILACYYTFTLSIIKFDLAIIIGIGSGFAILLPFIGPLLSFASCLLISYLNSGASNELIYISVIYGIGQVLEGTFLTPKIIGDRIGIHPIVILFAALVGGHLFGMVGIILAIPTAGITKIVLKRLI